MEQVEKEETLEELLERMAKKKEAHCPWCDYLISQPLKLYHIVTYYGYPHEPLQRVKCPKCKDDFYVKEFVYRTYETYQTRLEAEDERRTE